jgi:hypothetical protein
LGGERFSAAIRAGHLLNTASALLPSLLRRDLERDAIVVCAAFCCAVQVARGVQDHALG